MTRFRLRLRRAPPFICLSRAAKLAPRSVMRSTLRSRRSAVACFARSSVSRLATSSCCAASSSLSFSASATASLRRRPSSPACASSVSSSARTARHPSARVEIVRQAFGVPRLLVQRFLARGELRRALRQLVLHEAQLVVAHAQVLAQHLHLLRALGESFFELVDALAELLLRRRELADALALLELGVERFDAFVAALDAALQRLDVALAVDGLSWRLARLPSGDWRTRL